VARHYSKLEASRNTVSELVPEEPEAVKAA